MPYVLCWPPTGRVSALVVCSDEPQVRQLHHAASAAAPIPGAADLPGVAQSPQASLSGRGMTASWIARTLRSTLSAGSSMISSVLWNPVAPGPLVRPFSDFKLQERRGATPTSPVWRAAETQQGGRSMALKRLAFEGAGVAAFREAFLLFQLEHDNMLRLRALTRPPAVGFAYLVFDFYVRILTPACDTQELTAYRRPILSTS